MTVDRTIVYCTGTLAALLLAPLPAFSHHAFTGFFRMDSITEVEGGVTQVLWRNPHVRFSIATDNGETWDIESNSVSILRRMDITPELLSVGDRIRVAGGVARNGENAMFVNNVLLADGREVVLRPGVEPRWQRDTLGTSEVWLAEGAEGPGSSGGRDSMFRVWSTHFTGPSRSLWDGDYELTREAAAVQAAFDPIADDPIGDCTPKGMPWIMEQPYPMELVEQDGTILLRMEEYDTVRTFYMRPDATTDGPPSRLGHSVGRWEGDELVVETCGISWPHFNATGIQQSPDVALLERFAVNEDGSRLNYTLVVTDPATFTAPVVLDKQWMWRPGEVVRPYECTETD